MMKAAHRPFASIAVGVMAEFERAFEKGDVDEFAALSGDYHPLHVDEAYGAASPFGQNVVHGMLAGSLFSTLVGMYLPGEACLYFSQSLRFRKPIFIGEAVMVRGTVTAKHEATKMIVLKTEIMSKQRGIVAVDGEAMVQCQF